MITIVQQPEAYNLTAMLPDLILETEAEVVIEILIDNEIVLEETYTPDAVGRVYVRELGELLETYLAGSGFESTTQNGIVKEFTIKIDDEILNNYTVLYCTANITIPVIDVFGGNAFLHIMKQKWTTPTSKEYLSCIMKSEGFNTIRVVITTNYFVNSEPEEFAIVTTDSIKTYDISFAKIAEKFPTTNPDTIIAYRIYSGNEIAVYMVDRDKYLLTMCFRFMNNFGVPETITTRGMVRRKGVSTYDSAKMGNAETKFNIERDDIFTVNSGKIFSLNDYDRYREMFDSETVEIQFAGVWRNIIITEENSDQSLRLGNPEEISFKFKFSDTKHNNIISGDTFIRWILENGRWIDEYMWIDSGHWNG